MSKYQEIEDIFKKNVDDINKLMTFDKIILDISLKGLYELKNKLQSFIGDENPQLWAQNTITILESLRENESVRPRFQVIFNQSVVLLVSVFASSIADMFRTGICELALKGDSKALKNDDIKVTVEQLLEFDGKFNERLGDLIADKNDLSFQDMKSISRAFKQYFEFNIEKDEDVNNIIMAQASRHVIVHDSARISERMINQVKAAVPRNLKPDITGEYLTFSPDEVNIAANSMLNYLKGLKSKIEKRLNR
ncbi:MAG: hypothetical protein R3E90_10970 [Marinicella sp.]